MFGRMRLKGTQSDPLFALASAGPDLEAVGLSVSPTATFCYRPIDEPTFDDAKSEARQVVEMFAAEHAMTISESADSYGFAWLITHGGALDDRLTTLYSFSHTLSEHGFDDAPLALTVPISDSHGRAGHLVFNFKRGKFYPFAPLAQGRDNAWEMHLAALLKPHLPMEAELERWYPLTDIPG
ncbi:MAG: PspA-associated protein PspAB [Sulfobacillus sp.]